MEPIRLRLTIALGTGIVVGVLTLVTAWVAYGGFSFFPMDRFATLHRLQQLDAEIVAYVRRHGRPPATLAELRERAESEVEPDGVFHDGWGEPVVYSVSGDRYSITSLGADAAPGGTLESSDIVHGQPLPPEACPTLAELYSDERSNGMAALSFASGILATLAAPLAIQPGDLGGTGIRSLVLKLVCVAGASLALAAFLSLLEVPSGH